MNLTKLSFSAGVVLTVLVMLGLQAWLHDQWIAPRVAELDQLAQATKDQQRKTVAPGVSQTTARLNDLLSRLQKQPANETRLLHLHQLAAKQGVVWHKADYQTQPQSGGMVRLEIRADLSGTYPDIRLFLRDLMQQDEAAAIESLEFKRVNAGVHALVRLVLYSGQGMF